MLAEFSRLSHVEVDLVLRAPILTIILIAGADGKIDQKEINEAFKMAQKNARHSKSRLMEYYQFVAEDFEDKLKVIIQSYPSSTEQRNTMIVQELTQLNQVFPKIDKSFTKDLYKSMRDIAKKIAESSGGLLGMNSIGQEEAFFMNLPMIKDPSTY
jgi:flavorubredoxin